MNTKSVLFRGVYGLALVASVSLAVPQPVGTRPAAAPDPHFARVTKMLESGGSRLNYYNVDGVLNAILDWGVVASRVIPEPGAPAVVGGIVGAIKALGVTEVVALGGSKVTLAGGGSRATQVVAMSKRAGVFDLLETPTQDQVLLNAIPAETYGFTCLRVRFDKVIPLAEDVARRAAGSIGTQALKDFLARAKAEGRVDVEALLADFEGEIAIASLIADKSEAPTGRVLFMARTKSDATFKAVLALVEKNLGKAPETSIEGKWTVLDVKSPTNQGVLAFHSDNILAWASSKASLADVEAAKANPAKRVTGLEEFKKWSAGLDTRAAVVSFGSARSQGVWDTVGEEIAKESSEARAIVDLVLPLLREFSATQVAVVRVSDTDIVTEVQSAGDLSFDASSVSTLAVVGIMAAIAVPNFLEAQGRAKVSRTRSYQRALATGIESFYVDNSEYPLSTTDPKNAIARLQTPIGTIVPTFALSQLNHLPSPFHITTPISYLTSYLPDPFSTKDPDGNTFGYFSTRLETGDRGWIVFSPGPDGKFDLDWTKYDPKKGADQTDLYNDTYDPTNGTVSHGDIWRVKQ